MTEPTASDAPKTPDETADAATPDREPADSPATSQTQNDDDAKPTKAKKRRRWPWVLVGLFAGLVGLWKAAHTYPAVGSFIADSLRAVIGVNAVTKLEDFAYGLQDDWNGYWRKDEKPKAYWEVPTVSASALAESEVEVGGVTCKVPPFKPKDVGPVHSSWSAPGDGVWVPIADRKRPDAPLAMYKSLLHPDKNRSWTAVSLVAVDLRRIRLHMMAGRYEPKSDNQEARKYERKAIIPPDHQASLIAAFNGGFKAEHGHYGMKIDGVRIIRPRAMACWIGMMPKDKLVIADWKAAEPTEPQAIWWRQTPGCMVENSELHRGLASDKNTYWGATLDGDTVIRRSAIGLSADGKTLYSGIGDHTTARSMALAMKHAGAAAVAQLDVNWSYPKFVIYQPWSADAPAAPSSKATSRGKKPKKSLKKASKSELKEGDLVATKLCDGFEFSEDEYLRMRSQRDFFYLTLKSDDDVAATVCAPESPTAPTTDSSAAPNGSAAPDSSAAPSAKSAGSAAPSSTPTATP